MEEKKNINTLIGTASTITESFRRLKFITLASIIAMAVTAFGCVVWSLRAVSGMQDQVYVVDNGQVLGASRQDRAVTLGDRIEFQAKNLHHYLFTITPNYDVSQEYIERALEISDRSVYNYINDMNEKKTYRRMVESNSSQDIIVDSVRYSISSKPYIVVTYSTLEITRPSNITRYNLVTKCNMIDVDMNKKNREGLQVENFSIISNEKVGTRKRTQ